MSKRGTIDPKKPIRTPRCKKARRRRTTKRGSKKRSALLSPNPAKIFWVAFAACAGRPVEDFFVSAGKSASPEVLAVCRACPVRRDCVVHAYTGGVDDKPVKSGYFGGLSPDQRKKLSLEKALALVDSESLEQSSTNIRPKTSVVAVGLPLRRSSGGAPVSNR